MIVAVDPGSYESAFVLMDGLRIVNKAKVANERLLEALGQPGFRTDDDVLVIEVIDISYSFSGKEVFGTVFWSGRFAQAWGGRFHKLNRASIKAHLTGRATAKDGDVIKALTNRFGVKGTRDAPGYFYGFNRDVWQAYAVGVTAYDTGLTSDPTKSKL